MNRLPSSVRLLLLVVAAPAWLTACPNPPPTDDAGPPTTDAGVEADAGEPAADAGITPAVDAGADAGTTTPDDAGPSAPDAGVAADAGLVTSDAGAPADGGAEDAGTDDAGSTIDGGLPAPDAGTPVDAGTATADAGMPDDAWTTAPDAGTSGACAPVSPCADVVPNDEVLFHVDANGTSVDVVNVGTLAIGSTTRATVEAVFGAIAPDPLNPTGAPSAAPASPCGLSTTRTATTLMARRPAAMFWHGWSRSPWPTQASSAPGSLKANRVETGWPRCRRSRPPPASRTTTPHSTLTQASASACGRAPASLTSSRPTSRKTQRAGRSTSTSPR